MSQAANSAPTSVVYQLSRETSPSRAPAAARTTSRLSSARSTCARMSPAWSGRPSSSTEACPAQKIVRPGREIIDFCRDHIAHFKCPVAVEFGPLPKTSTGKVQKYVLREQEWAGRQTRVN